MNFGEAKQKILGLGFEEMQSYTDNAQKFVDAMNRSIKIISQTTIPMLKSYEIALVEGTGFTRYDLKELTKTDRVIFDVLKKVTFETSEEYSPVTQYDVENGSTIILKNDKTGKITVWFSIKPKELTITSLDAEEIELDYSVAELLPLLASYYIWLDDEERKAITYRNDYDDLKTQIIGGGLMTPSLEIVGGF